MWGDHGLGMLESAVWDCLPEQDGPWMKLETSIAELNKFCETPYYKMVNPEHRKEVTIVINKLQMMLANEAPDSYDDWGPSDFLQECAQRAALFWAPTICFKSVDLSFPNELGRFQTYRFVVLR